MPFGIPIRYKVRACSTPVKSFTRRGGNWSAVASLPRLPAFASYPVCTHLSWPEHGWRPLAWRVTSRDGRGWGTEKSQIQPDLAVTSQGIDIVDVIVRWF